MQLEALKAHLLHVPGRAGGLDLEQEQPGKWLRRLS